MPTSNSPTVTEVAEFWEANPLFSGESEHEPGTQAYFEEHRKVYIEDVFAGQFPENLFVPTFKQAAKILDLGCGAGFWTVELLLRGNNNGEMFAGDLTQKALDLTQKRLELYQLNAHLSQQNAEALTFDTASFDHVNCQGVIHHTPNTEQCVAEIARVLKPDGTAYISVYYKNFFLKNWKYIAPIGKVLSYLGGQLKGRGRENIFAEDDINNIVKLYDGKDNPIGKAYSKQDCLNMVAPYFEVDKVFLNFFPARALPFSIPKSFHQWLSQHFGFMIHLNLRKKSNI